MEVEVYRRRRVEGTASGSQPGQWAVAAGDGLRRRTGRLLCPFRRQTRPTGPTARCDALCDTLWSHVILEASRITCDHRVSQSGLTMLLLVNKLHFRLLGFTPRRSLSSSLTLIVNSTIVMPSRFVTAASHHTHKYCDGSIITPARVARGEYVAGCTMELQKG